MLNCKLCFKLWGKRIVLKTEIKPEKKPSLQQGGLTVVRLLKWWLTSHRAVSQEYLEEAAAPFVTQPQTSHTITSSEFYGAEQSQVHPESKGREIEAPT